MTRAKRRLTEHWWDGLILLIVVALVVLLLTHNALVLGLVLAFILGLLVYRATHIRPGPLTEQATVALCGPVGHTNPVLTPATPDQRGSLVIGGQTIPIASGTTLENGGVAATPPDQLCLTGTLNGAGQLISGTLSNTTSPARTLSYRGPVTDLRNAPGEQSNALSLSGLAVPLAPNAALRGAELLTPFGGPRSLTAELNDTGQIASGKLVRAGPGSASHFFWLELVYLLILLGFAVLYFYPDTAPGGTLTATLVSPTSFLLQASTPAKIITKLTLVPVSGGVPSTHTPSTQPVAQGAMVTVGPSTTTSPVVIARGTIVLSPDGVVTLPKGAIATFTDQLPIATQSAQGYATGLKTYSLALLDPALATLFHSSTPVQLSLGKQATSTPWDDLLLWLQDARRWLHRAFPNPFGSIPLAIFWLGALGSVIRGLSVAVGTADVSAYPWYYNSEYWHVARPIIGAAFALFTYLFFLSILDPTGKANVGGEYGTYLLAFIVGYSDGTFAALIERAINVLLGPGNPQGPHAGS